MAKLLGGFRIARAGEDYVIQIDDEDGETSEFTADYDQLELIAEEIENLLDEDEEDALSADDAEDGDEIRDEED